MNRELHKPKAEQPSDINHPRAIGLFVLRFKEEIATELRSRGVARFPNNNPTQVTDLLVEIQLHKPNHQ